MAQSNVGTDADKLSPNTFLGDVAFTNLIDLLGLTGAVYSLDQLRGKQDITAPAIAVTDSTARGLFVWESTDTTSADDGFTVLVSGNGRRYVRIGMARMTSIQRDALTTPQDGLIVYVTDGTTPGFSSRVASAWRRFLTTASGAVTYIEGTLGIGISAPVGAFEVQANNPSGGELSRFTNNSNAAGRSGAKIGIHQAGVSIWRIGMQPDSDALTFEALNSSVFNEFVRILGAGQGGNMGNTGFSTAAPTSRLHINGATGANQLRLEKSFTPSSSADAAGQQGDTAWDANYFYIKTAAGWKRTALTTF